VLLSDMNNGGTFSNTATLDTTQTAAITSAAETTAVTQTATMNIVKTHVITTDNGTLGEADPGDIITYTYDVTNTGNVTITNISVSDAHSGTGAHHPCPHPLSWPPGAGRHHTVHRHLPGDAGRHRQSVVWAEEGCLLCRSSGCWPPSQSVDAALTWRVPRRPLP
jgi:hypothetical protein